LADVARARGRPAGGGPGERRGRGRRRGTTGGRCRLDVEDEEGMYDMWDPQNPKPYDMWDPLTEWKLSYIPYLIPPTKQKRGSEPL
jgi:hypothetical protein